MSSAFLYCTIPDEKVIGKTNMEEAEDISYHWLNPEEFKKYIHQHKDILVANDVMSFMLQYLLTWALLKLWTKKIMKANVKGGFHRLA